MRNSCSAWQIVSFFAALLYFLLTWRSHSYPTATWWSPLPAASRDASTNIWVSKLPVRRRLPTPLGARNSATAPAPNPTGSRINDVTTPARHAMQGRHGAPTTSKNNYATFPAAAPVPTPSKATVLVTSQPLSTALIRDAHESTASAVCPPSSGCTKLLLIIVFNSAYYSNIPYIRKLYGSAFCHIVFYGPVPNSTIPVIHNQDPTGGYLQHKTIAKAYRDNPGYKGYLWAGDDVLFIPKQFLASKSALSLDKVWVKKTQPVDMVDMNGLPGHWIWRTPFKGKQPKANYAGLAAFLKQRLPQRILERQRKVFKGEKLLGTGADFGYIPGGALMDEFAMLAEMTELSELSFEIFIPTFSRLLSDREDNFVEFQGIYLWSSKDRSSWSKLINCSAVAALHPVKLSTTRNRELITNLSMTTKCTWTWKPEPSLC
eukprot:scpid82629/ scgid0233/ 